MKTPRRSAPHCNRSTTTAAVSTTLSWARSTSSRQGDHVDVDPPGPSSQDVPQGQQPNFRLDSEEAGEPLRLVLNLSNEPFGQPNESRGQIDEIQDRGALVPPDIPTFEQVIEEPQASGVKQLGVDMGSDRFTDARSQARCQGNRCAGPRAGRRLRRRRHPGYRSGQAARVQPGW